MRLTPSVPTRRRTIRLWLLAVAALIFATVIVGGATRLTESGLSIIEWKPVTGVIPPFQLSAWQAEFEKYKTIPQYRERHPGMSLDEFKTIYWWEWTHRLLARLVGGVFLVPFLWFLWRGWIDPSLPRTVVTPLPGTRSSTVARAPQPVRSPPTSMSTFDLGTAALISAEFGQA
jgi:heme A synthase